MREIESDPARPLKLADLARRAGYSPAHLQRNFTAIAGSSPKAFQTAARLRLVKKSLRSAASVTDAIADAGFGSTSRLYEKTDAALGMTPSEYRRGGAGLTIAWATGDTALGRVLIGATTRGICALAFGTSVTELERDLKREFPNAVMSPMPKQSRGEFTRWMLALNQYLAGKLRRLDLPIDAQGTAFQLLVWRYLRTVPRGETRSYARVARDLDRPKSARAVATACASNRIAVIIPCHRVVRGTGEISGYRWGVTSSASSHKPAATARSMATNLPAATTHRQQLSQAPTRSYHPLQKNKRQLHA
jgi:AraC family transcriptional regulator of adaptative response/methylated-DNA-[protein]-cysteine methyltransferase